MTNVIKKVLAGLEDFSLGYGTENQIRGGQHVSITKVNAEWIFNSISDIKSIDVSKIKHVTLITSGNVIRKYDYLSSSTLVSNDDDVLLPVSGIGRWVLRRENNTQTHTTEEDAAGATHEGIEPGFIIQVIQDGSSGSGSTTVYYQYTGVTLPDKAGEWPSDDGFYYDANGNQFQVYDNAKLPIGIRTVGSTSYTLDALDALVSGGKSAVRTISGSTVNITVPNNSAVAFPIGAVVNIIQGGAGQVNLLQASGVTINGGTSTRGQYRALSIIKVGLNEWDSIGGTGGDSGSPITITLNNHTLTATNALCGISLASDGELTIIDSSGSNDSLEEWCVPRTPGIGNNYECRLFPNEDGEYDLPNIGSMTSVWLRLSDIKGWGLQASAATGTLNFQGVLEIRSFETKNVIDSCQINLTSVYESE